MNRRKVSPVDVADDDRQRQLQILTQRLIDTEAEIERLSDGQIDSIVLPSIEPILLRRARESLRLSEQRFRAVFDNALDAMVVADDNGCYIDANPTACALFGLSRSELLGRHVADFSIPEEDTHANWKAFQSAGKMLGEFVVVRPDGSRRIAEFSAVTDILPGRHLSILRDVTARKEAEAQLARLTEQVQAQAQHLEQVMDMAPTGLFLLDQHSRIVLANRQAEAMLRFIADVGIGDTIQHLAGRPLQEFLKSAGNGTLPTQLVIDKSERQVFNVLANPVSLHNDESGWVLFLHNVTIEQERQERVQQQERLVAIGQMAAGIAHDFNNLLAVIMLFTQLIQRNSDLNQDVHHRLAVILEKGAHASHLVEQFLDFGRKSMMERRPIDMLKYVAETVALCKMTLPDTIRIDLLCEGQGDYVVNADAARLRQVLMNLIVNASDALEQVGEIHLGLNHLHLAVGKAAPLPEMAPGAWVAITVRDTGSGIAAEHLARIFDPFFTTKGFGKGSGLGLAQVYGIVHQHEGVIGVQSQVGQGTTFTVYLPSVELPVLALEPERVLITRTLALDQHTILLVEDNRDVREATRVILEAHGYRVLESENGRQATELFHRHRGEIALVLSDLVMPEMGGVELYRLLRETDATVKMMIMSGYLLEDDSRQLLEEGVVAWLQKPFGFDELAEKVRRVLHDAP